jgi:hypothetical protein
MLRLFALAVAAVLLWLMLERGIAAVRTRLRGGGSPGRAVPPARPVAALPLVRCVSCGVHLPQQRALEVVGRWYCSPACRQAAGGEDP